jgi:hypothetical protein
MNVLSVLIDYLQQHTAGYAWRILSSRGSLTVYIEKEGEANYPCNNEDVIECNKKGIFIVQMDNVLVIANNTVGGTQLVDLFHPNCFQQVLDIIQSWPT